MSKLIRVPSTTVELVQILGRVIRQHLKMQVSKTECWTFEHVGNYEVCDSIAVSEIAIYLGYGHCYVLSEGMTAQHSLQVCCQLSTLNTGTKRWDLQLWIKEPSDSEITKCSSYTCTCHPDFTISDGSNATFPDNPPYRG